MGRIEDQHPQDDVEFRPLDCETLSTRRDLNRQFIFALARKLAVREPATFEAKEACLRRAARVFLVDDTEGFAATHLTDFLDELD